jgi:hypothetical protein
MARPSLPQKSVVVRVALFLRPGEDDDLIEFFASIPVDLRASALKLALRSGKMQVNLAELAELPSDDDIEESLDNLLG